MWNDGRGNAPALRPISLHQGQRKASRPGPFREPRDRPAARGGSVGRKRTGRRLHGYGGSADGATTLRDRKSTRLNSSHVSISYAVFCLKKKKKAERWIASRVPATAGDVGMEVGGVLVVAGLVVV